MSDRIEINLDGKVQVIPLHYGHGIEVVLYADNGDGTFDGKFIVDNIAGPDQDDLAWARDDLGANATEAQVLEVATRRSSERATEVMRNPEQRLSDKEALDRLSAVAVAHTDGWNGGDCVDLVCQLLTATGRPVDHEDPAPVEVDLDAEVFHYYATFTPQAWVRDNALDVDPAGETQWNATVEVLSNMEYFERLAAEDGNHFQDVLDNDDVLKGDPAAPEWVREWTGPFSIHVSRQRNHAPDCDGLHDNDECCRGCGLHVTHDGRCARK